MKKKLTLKSRMCRVETVLAAVVKAQNVKTSINLNYKMILW